MGGGWRLAPERARTKRDIQWGFLSPRVLAGGCVGRHVSHGEVAGGELRRPVAVAALPEDDAQVVRRLPRHVALAAQRLEHRTLRLEQGQRVAVTAQPQQQQQQPNDT